MKKLAAVLFVFYVFIACTNNETTFQEGNQSLSFVKELRETGKGDYNDGRKSGVWEYKTESNQQLKVGWSYFEEAKNGFSFSIPSEFYFDVIEEGYLKLKDSVNKEQLVIIEHSKSKVSGLSEYHQLVKAKIPSDSKINIEDPVAQKIEFLYNKRDSAMFLLFVIPKGEKINTFLSLYIEQEDKIQDITYRFNVENGIDIAQVIFWEFLLSIEKNGKRFLIEEKFRLSTSSNL